jgi:hypothetical protein
MIGHGLKPGPGTDGRREGANHGEQLRRGKSSRKGEFTDAVRQYLAAQSFASGDVGADRLAVHQETPIGRDQLEGLVRHAHQKRPESGLLGFLISGAVPEAGR